MDPTDDLIRRRREELQADRTEIVHRIEEIDAEKAKISREMTLLTQEQLLASKFSFLAQKTGAPVPVEEGERRAPFDALYSYLELQRMGLKLGHAQVVSVEWPEISGLYEDILFYLRESGVSPQLYIQRVIELAAPPPFQDAWLGINQPGMVYFEVGSVDGPRPRENYRVSSCMMGWWCQGHHVRLYMGNADGEVTCLDFDRIGANLVEEAALYAIPFIIWTVLSQQAHIVRETGLHAISRDRLRKRLETVERLPPGLTIPRKYHKVLIRGSLNWVSTSRKAIIGTGPCWRHIHRSKVRGHYRIRIRRGPGLVPEDLVEALDPKYVWLDDARKDFDEYVGKELPANIEELLHERDQAPRRPGEWVGILCSWIDEHDRGPADAPYVPAIWVAHLPDVADKPGIR